jgi:hypothetical protein
MVLKKKLDNYPGYTIHNNGKLFSEYSNKYISLTLVSGYYNVKIKNKKGKHCHVSIHRLVAISFVKNDDPDKKTHVDHINGDMLNNDYKNLKWVTHSENMRKANRTKTCNITVRQYTISGKFVKEYKSMLEASKLTGSSDYMIRQCCKKKCKNAKAKDDKKYVWKYKHEKQTIDVPVGKTIKNLSKYIFCKNGMVYSRASNKYLKLTPKYSGYIQVGLTNDDGYTKPYLVHRLIICAYNGPSDLMVNHKNSIRHDNKLDNLEYVTASQNTIHSFEHGNNQKYKKAVYKLDPDTLKIIKKYNSITEAAKDNDAHATAITRVCKGKKKTTVGFAWKYVNPK